LAQKLGEQGIHTFDELAALLPPPAAGGAAAADRLKELLERVVPANRTGHSIKIRHALGKSVAPPPAPAPALTPPPPVVAIPAPAPSPAALCAFCGAHPQHHGLFYCSARCRDLAGAAGWRDGKPPPAAAAAAASPSPAPPPMYPPAPAPAPPTPPPAYGALPVADPRVTQVQEAGRSMGASWSVAGCTRAVAAVGGGGGFNLDQAVSWCFSHQTDPTFNVMPAAATATAAAAAAPSPQPRGGGGAGATVYAQPAGQPAPPGYQLPVAAPAPWAAVRSSSALYIIDYIMYMICRACVCVCVCPAGTAGSVRARGRAC
jgi:hypothetical protein